MPSAARLTRWVCAAAPQAEQITIRLVTQAEGRGLNLAYRGKDYATNVLTFDYERAPVVVADIVLCAPIVEREAGERRIDVAAHYANLLVHGALHAQGHEHESAAEARRMEARESEVLATLGIDDPYGG